MKHAPELRVALFTDSDVYAGTESYMLTLACELRKRDVAVLMACPVPSVLAEKASGFSLPTVEIAKGGLIDRTAIMKCVQLLRSRTVDIIHANNGRTTLAAAAAVSLARRGACVYTQHFLSPDHVGRNGVKAALSNVGHSWMNRRTSQVIAISEAVRHEILARNEVVAEKITVVPNGIAPPDITALRAKNEVREEFGIHDDAPLVVCAARLQREKDIVTLIRAMKFVVAAIPDAVCLIAGEGAELTNLEAAIRDLDLRDSVRLIGFRSDVQSVIRAANVFVLPSIAEPFGLVLLEAMSVSVPIVACRAGAPPEIVVEGVTGRLVPPSSPDTLSATLCGLLQNSSVAAEMGRQARLRYESSFTAERMACDTHSVYMKAMSCS